MKSAPFTFRLGGGRCAGESGWCMQRQVLVDITFVPELTYNDKQWARQLDCLVSKGHSMSGVL